MAPTSNPGSSEPYNLDEDAATSPPLSSYDPVELHTVPQHPHTKDKTASSTTNYQPRHQLSSVPHPTITSSTRQNSKNESDRAGAAVDGQTKRKSIGSKVLSKFKRTTNETVDPAHGSRSHHTSGSQTPEHPSHLDHSDAEVKAHQLQQALSKEQQRRANARSPSSGTLR